ncbi:polar amino acid transport system substrate-binding protein [Methanococcus maripaludis]|uniref:Polar amino acid transport system substrate-binding protein n=1 Tax=Methanococcus maripaludis TaxID=39152 RepID=A0A7J9NSL6_METMI|nr:ABC transporter substrate-binding protein [Methanococcus maripaludis]MBA2849963.1 polar amino acid transport system substrate-binding protein [Methanococcus maripaludis]
MKNAVIFSVLLVIISCACISSDSNTTTLKDGVLTVGVFKYVPPAVYEENGELKGYEVELISEIAERMDLKVEYKEYMFSDLLNAVANNEVDCAISDIAVTPEREKIVSFSRAYSKTDIILVVPKDSDIEKLTDIIGQKVGVTAGTIDDDKSSELLKSIDFQVCRYATHDELYDALEGGNVDAIISEENNFESVQNSSINYLDEPIATVYCGIAVNKDNKELRLKINDIILELEQEGYFNQ